MKKAIAVLALVLIVLAGVFAEATLSVGAGAYGVFKEDTSFDVGPAIRFFSTKGGTYNKLSVESPLWTKNLENIVDFPGYDFENYKDKLFKKINVDETFGIAFNLLGEDGLLGLTIGAGVNLSGTGVFLDADSREIKVTAGAGADVNFEIKVAKPLTIVVGASANYPMYYLDVTKNGNSNNWTHGPLLNEGIINVSAHLGVGLSL